MAIVRAVADGHAVDWATAIDATPEPHRLLAQRLQAISRVVAAHDRPDRGDDPAPERWGPLEILERIGAGAFGEVYRARDPRLDREVALKLYRRESTPRHRSEVVEEARLLARVQHPNVVIVHGAGQQDGRTGIWMELIDGDTLEDIVVQQGPLRAEEAMRIGRDVCRALAALHTAGVLHRDIKARNVMRDRDGRIVLMDLGVGAEIEAQASLGPYGTPLYAAPEVLLEGEASRRSDLYGVGVLLYHLVTGLYPVSGRSLADLREAHRQGHRRPVRQRRPELPDAFVRIVDQSTSANPDQRFATAGHFEQALDWALGELTRNGVLSRRDLPSLAVLPFTDLSPEQDQGYLCDGLAEELINALVKIEGLKVAAYTSTVQAVRRGMGIRQLGSRLAVGTVLEGSVRQADDRLRISARLNQVSDGFPFWSESFEVPLQDVFSVQEDIAQAIVARLKVEMLADASGTLVAQHTSDARAYNFYLQGRYHFLRRYEGGLEKALECFAEAIRCDARYPLPYVGIADCYNILSYFEFIPPRTGFPKAREAAARALELDDTLGEAHASLGWYDMFHAWDFVAAERRFRRAIELYPRWGMAHMWYATLLSGLGRFDASVTEARLAIALDPLSPAVGGSEGVCFYLHRRCEEAIACLSRLVAVHPDFPQARTQLAHAYTYDGQHDEAEQHLLKALDVYPDFPYALRVLGYSYARSGRREKARQILALMKARQRERHVGTHNFAFIELALGHTDRALDLLEQARRERDPVLFFAKVAQECDPVRDHPRFQTLLEKLGHLD